MATEVGWVIMERGFEYNDEYYEMQEGGSPFKVYQDKEKAERECLILNRGQWCTVPPFLYVSYYDDNREIFVELGLEANDWNSTLPENISEEDIQKILAQFPDYFFYIKKVSIENG